jgi:hypothetical protein
VLPTKLALKRYEDISKCLEKALKSAWRLDEYLVNKKALLAITGLFVRISSQALNVE